MTVDILVVCAAHVCRSPIADAMLTRALADAGHAAGIRVRSGGVAVPGPRAACSAIRTYARPGAEITLQLRDHVARRLQRSDIERADLVLAADRAVRNVLVRGVPRGQARIFTLRQAAQLAAFVASEHRPAPEALPEHGDHAMRRFVADLDMARGLASPRTSDRSRGWGRAEVHPHDIPDAHTTGATHAAVARLLVEAVDHLASALVHVLPAPSDGVRISD